MAQLQIAHEDLRKLVESGKQETIEELTMLGFPTEETSEGLLNVEVTPNRPDALCVEGLARVLRCYKTGVPAAYKVATPQIEVLVEKSVESVRPAFGGAVVRNVNMDDSLLRSLMQLQEKLHDTLGRKRRKLAIGIHDMDCVSPPFSYFACGRKDATFVPLDSTEKMTPEDVLSKHPKGIAFAHLVGEKCPMIEDRNGSVLSFPPIINGELTKLTTSTKNVFIDCTGSSNEAVQQAVNIVAAALSDRGGAVEQIKINGVPYPILQEARWHLPVAASERLLGIKLTHEQVAGFLSKMGHRVSGKEVYVPGYRVDVMNEVDLVEDVAIAYGFNNFEPHLPEFASVGHANPENACHEMLVGMGYDEVLTWHLSNPNLAKKAGCAIKAFAEIENPLTSDFTIFRSALLPNLLSVFAESKNEKLPIRVYELGPVALPHLEEHLCLASMHPRASFSEIKGAVLSLCASLGLKANVKEEDSPSFINGRCAALIVDGKKAGLFGEVSPACLSEFSLEQPVCAAELKAGIFRTK